MNGRFFSRVTRWGIIIVLGMAVIAGIGLGGNRFSHWSQRVALALENHPEPESNLSPSLGSFQADESRSTNSFSAGINSILSSTITTRQCYQEDDTRTMCFTVHNASPDGEWLDQVRLTFPDISGAWTVACNFQDANDSLGYPVSMNCANNGVKEIVYTDNDADGFGEISSGASWMFCADVTVPSGYDGQRIVNWGLSGDESAGTGTPHDITGQLSLEQCTPLMLSPSYQLIEGCNGTRQTLTFELWNNTAPAGQYNLNYLVPSGNGSFSGPSNFYLSPGWAVTFTTSITPNLNLKPGEMLIVNLEAEGMGEFDDSAVEFSITPNAGWQRRTDSITPTMDSVVVWASHRDGGLWSIGGYGSEGATQRFEPGSNTWETFEPQSVITPLIEYPVDGCYGLDGPNPETAHEIVVLFPDTLLTDTLQVFDITDHNWYTRPIPGFFPGNYIGFWGFDVVSLLNNPAVHDIPDPNMCYLSGGNHENPGGGTTRNLWRYDPETNGGQYVGNFADSGTAFGFHASWYVPWIGNQGAICVAGGADHNHFIHNSTQCYDINDNSFLPLNDPLGPLPEPWWGMADGWQIYNGEYQIWLANGVAQDGTLLPISAYASESSGGFQMGPTVPKGLYRLEGDGFEGKFYTLGGSQGGFWYSQYAFLLEHCPACFQNFIPLIFK